MHYGPHFVKLHSMRIASYNIRKAVGLDWRRDPERIADVLLEINADIVVLQEADRRVGTREGVLPLYRLERELGYRLPDLSVRPLSHGWHGNAILTRAGFGHHATERIPLPNVEPRGAVSVCIDAPKMEVIGVHLGLTPGMRRKQMRALQEVVRTREHPVILAGDFNEWNSARFVFDKAMQVIAPGPSFHAARPAAELDRFVIPRSMVVRDTFVHTSDLASIASDHLPVVLDIVPKEASS